jgi:hypothetical protein
MTVVPSRAATVALNCRSRVSVSEFLSQSGLKRLIGEEEP